MKCIISGFETNNKWDNKPVEKVWVEAAKALKKDRPNLTMREALQLVHKEFNKAVDKLMTHAKVDQNNAPASCSDQERSENHG